MKSIAKLSDLYEKIQNGKATQDELIQYDLEISKSCVDPNTLIQLIKEEMEKKRV